MVLDVQEQSHEVFTRLLIWRRELEALDRKLQLGEPVLIIEYDAHSATNLSPRILKLPWKKAEGKQQKVCEAMQDWWYHLRNSEQVDYVTESNNDQTTTKLTAGRAPRELSFKTVSSEIILLFCRNAKDGQSECAHIKYKCISLTFSVNYHIIPVHSNDATPGEAVVVAIRKSRGAE